MVENIFDSLGGGRGRLSAPALTFTTIWSAFIGSIYTVDVLEHTSQWIRLDQLGGSVLSRTKLTVEFVA